VPPLPRLAARRDHLVVCGDDALAARAGLSGVLAQSQPPR